MAAGAPPAGAATATLHCLQKAAAPTQLRIKFPSDTAHLQAGVSLWVPFFSLQHRSLSQHEAVLQALANYQLRCQSSMQPPGTKAPICRFHGSKEAVCKSIYFYFILKLSFQRESASSNLHRTDTALYTDILSESPIIWAQQNSDPLPAPHVLPHTAGRGGTDIAF